MAAAAVEFDDFVIWKLNYMRDRLIADETVLYVKLFLNNVTITPDTVLGDLTIATDSGLAAQQEFVTDWGDAVVTAHVAVMTSEVLHTWTLSGSPKTVYGYVVTNEDGDLPIFGETFSTPIAMVAGQSLTVQTRIKDRSQMF